MLSLPSKPWKKIKLETVGKDSYRLVFLTDMATEDEFNETIGKDVVPCLTPKDSLGPADWASRSVTFTTKDLVTFKRNLVFACLMVEIE
jgi:hypothetical protein